jgi:hypothetical protein
MTQLFDVIEVNTETWKVTLMGERKSERKAEAVERMAIMRRSADHNFFTTVETGTYLDGDTYKDD